MTLNQTGLVRIRTSGAVPAAMAALATAKVNAVVRHVGEPVLFAAVTLTMAADPAADRPAAASAAVSVNGRIVRAHATAGTLPEAIGMLTARLRVRLDRAWPHHREEARRGRERPRPVQRSA